MSFELNNQIIAVINANRNLVNSFKRLLSFVFNLESNKIMEIINVYTNLKLPETIRIIVYFFPEDFSKDIYLEIIRVNKLKGNNIYFSLSTKETLVKNYSSSFISYNERNNIITNINLVNTIETFSKKIKETI